LASKKEVFVFVDSHCHLDRLDKNGPALDEVVKQALAANVEHMLCVAVSVKEFAQMKSTVGHYPDVSMSCGVHPLHNEDVCDYETLLAHAQYDDVVAVGETGLDYFYSEETASVQMKSFVDHIKVANVVKKPLIIHTRSAQEDTLQALKENYDPRTGAVLHCFTESLEMAQAAMQMGIYISISGIVTFSSAKELQETVKQIPLDKLLIETDSPWLAPVPFRGKKNEPKHVIEVAKFIAKLKGVSIEKLAQHTTENFYRLFTHINRGSI
jgi:TatD DNase family protein